MNKGYTKSKAKESVNKGYAKDVNVVNTPTVKISHDSKPSLPSLSLSDKDLPAIKDWEVDGKYTLTLEVEQTSKSKGDNYMIADSDSEDKGIRASFKILSVKGSKS